MFRGSKYSAQCCVDFFDLVATDDRDHDDPDPDKLNQQVVKAENHQKQDWNIQKSKIRRKRGQNAIAPGPVAHHRPYPEAGSVWVMDNSINFKLDWNKHGRKRAFAMKR